MPGTLLSPDKYLKFLTTRDHIDVHQFDKPAKRGSFIEPDRLSAKDAVNLICDKQSGPDNLLNLSGYRQNAVPLCIDGNPALRLLVDVNTKSSGKTATEQTDELSSCATFTLLGKAGAFSGPHRDRHWLLTSAYNEEGEKLWMT